MQVWLWAIGVSLQLMMPVFAWATVKNMITVHLTHLTERHGLFTIIVLGEGLVSLVTKASQAATLWDWVILAAGFLLLIGLWLAYFKWDARAVEMKGLVRTFAYNYGHLALYCSLGIVAAGLGESLMFAALGAGLFIVVLFLLEMITKRS